MNRWVRGLPAGIGLIASLAACGSSQSAPASASTSAAVALPAASSLASSPAMSSTPVCGPAAVVARLMGIKDFTAYTATTDPNHLLGRQGEYTSKINWGQDRGNGDAFSSVEVFPDAADARLRGHPATVDHLHSFAGLGDGLLLRTGLPGIFVTTLPPSPPRCDWMIPLPR
jgi:hypothetical protein